MKTLVFGIILLLSANVLTAQTQTEVQATEKKFYLGLGFGFDYGGFGIKAEYLPIKHVGFFGGLGYNLLSAGWNLGAAYKILPDKKICPNIAVMYGYNGALKGKDDYAKRYEGTSYSVTFGGGIDIKVGKKGNKISTYLFVPIRSGSFMDKYDAMRDDPMISSEGELLPIGISIGYNFAL